jgi:NitT/TauT family transport system substrate-binding protein
MRTRISAIAAAAVALAATSAAAQTAVKFALDWKFEGPAAPYLVAIDKGFYKAEGLEVAIDTGSGSVEGINRVASATYQFGFADINSLVKFRDKNPDRAVKGIAMIYDAPPFAIASLAKAGIKAPKDLEGKILGAPAPDGAYAQWKAFVKENRIDASKVTIQNIGFPVREPMLAAGQVDAITGFSFSMFFNLRAKDVPAGDIRIMLMSDHGLGLYGNVVMVEPGFARANPALVRGFVKATIRGWQDAVKDPEGAIKSLMKRNQIADEKVELDRLRMSIKDNVRTPWVTANGYGGIDEARLARSIEQIAVTYDFTAKPKPGDVFTSEYLPPKGERMLP